MGVPADPEVLEQLREAGVRRVVHWLPSDGRGAGGARAGRWENAIVELNGG